MSSHNYKIDKRIISAIETEDFECLYEWSDNEYFPYRIVMDKFPYMYAKSDEMFEFLLPNKYMITYKSSGEFESNALARAIYKNFTNSMIYLLSFGIKLWGRNVAKYWRKIIANNDITKINLFIELEVDKNRYISEKMKKKGYEVLISNIEQKFLPAQEKVINNIAKIYENKIEQVNAMC